MLGSVTVVTEVNNSLHSDRNIIKILVPYFDNLQFFYENQLR